MDRLDAMRMFAAAIDGGSLAAAARRLGRSPASITRAITLLEAHAGERLLFRTTRRLRLTERGERFLGGCRTILAELDALETGAEAARAPGGELSGRIAISAPELFGRSAVMPAAEDVLAAHPEVRLRALLVNRTVDLVAEGIDVAVRLAELPDSVLRAVRLGEVRPLYCAAASYLRRSGSPATPEELGRHRCIDGAGEGEMQVIWRFGIDGGGPAPRFRRGVPVRPHLALNSAGAAVDAAVRGSGICRAMSYQVAEHLAAGRLVRLLRPFEPPPVPVHLLFHAAGRRDRLLRHFVESMTPLLRRDLDRQALLLATAPDPGA
ncbi:LysR family transcriptional regulator [Rhizosaccharibacter radicis]|uniref:LysR family transcriptional regulator n=1 Tax=Rhizosaccharibacter radicis TaxID=2782605 RepID=A0ABT1W041_9PROT|nr:LysR family transcriptional regulator [Acetobacteraceae bacterium KSS12]